MSIRAMSHVWDTSKQKGASLLLMLAIADYANDSGTAWPAVETLSNKIRMHESYTHRLINKLVESGELVVEERAGPHGCNLFTIPGVPPEGGRTGGRVARARPGGRTGASEGVAQEVPDPSVNHQEPSSVTPTAEVQAEYEKLLGRKVTNWAAGEATAAKQIGQSFTAAQLAEAYKHYKAQTFWKDKRVSLSYLAKNMPDFLAAPPAPPIARPAGSGPWGSRPSNLK